MLFYIRLAIVYPDILSSDEQRDVNDIDLSDVESDSEEDFDSVEMDYETALWESRNKVHVLNCINNYYHYSLIHNRYCL